jgi:glucosamine-6-phosphate deaminase
MFNDDTDVFEDARLVASAAADAFIASALAAGSQPAGLATGRTMAPVYDHLVEAEHQSEGLFARTTFSQLDEVLEKAPTTNCFSTEIKDNLLSRFSSDYAGFMTIAANSPNPLAEAERHYDNIQKAGGLGVQLLGIGVNGHVGFNEPGSAADSRCRVIDLTDSTIQRNGYDPGMQAITLGIADIMAARQIILIATGTAKAAAIEAMITGPKTIDCPASLLRDHPDIRLFLDKAAASKLS